MTSTQLKQERARVFEQMKALNDLADRENRDLSAEERQSYDRMDGEFERLTQRIADTEKQEERERLLFGDAGVPAGTPEGGTRDERREAETREKAYEDAFMRYLRGGLMDLEVEQRKLLLQGVQELPQELRDLSKGTNSAGGFTVPTGFLNRLLLAVEEDVVVRSLGATRIQTTTGETLPWPKVTAYGANATITAENTAITFVDDTFDQDSVSAYTYPTGTKVSFQLLADTAVDLEGFLRGRMTERIARAQNAHFLTGTGSGQPEGIVTAVPSGQIVTGATGQTLTVTGDDLIDVMYKIKPAFRRRAKWLMNDQMMKVIRKLKDADGQYLFQVSLREGEPDMLLGKPFFVDANMPTPAASAKSIVFGDFGGYLIRDVAAIAMRRLDERFADALQVGFLAWMRSDGMVQDENAFAVYRHAAS